VIETELSWSSRKKEKTPSQHAHILHKHDHLHAIRKIRVKDECGWNEEEDE
jgi:hypothetical protein